MFNLEIVATGFTALFIICLAIIMFVNPPGWFVGSYLGVLVVASGGLLMGNGSWSEHMPQDANEHHYEHEDC